MSSIVVRNLKKFFDGAYALKGVDLDIDDGELLCVLGPSGCGKSTLLRLLAGLERADEGSIAFDGAIVSGPGRHVAPEDRRVGMVFQSYALWPHMNVSGNVGYPLRVEGASGEERRRRIAQALESVRLSSLAERPPHALSGGQQQRVALARCLVMRPRLVLMDEPLANLDPHLREEMLAEFSRFHRETGATMLYVTHDQAEAMSIADRVAVMSGGRLLQAGPPETLYSEPADVEVAAFVGASSLLRARAAGEKAVRWDGAVLPVRAARPLIEGESVVLCVRPENVRIGEGERSATVERLLYQGGRYLVHLVADGGDRLKAYSPLRLTPQERTPFDLSGVYAIPEA